MSERISDERLAEIHAALYDVADMAPDEMATLDELIERRRADALRGETAWIPVSQRLPRDRREGNEFLVSCESGYVTCLNWNGEVFYADLESLKTKFWMGEVVAWMKKPDAWNAARALPGVEE